MKSVLIEQVLPVIIKGGKKGLQKTKLFCATVS